MTRFLPPRPQDLQDAMARAQKALPPLLLDIVDVVPRFEELTAAWHQQAVEPGGASSCMRRCAERLHLYNFRLWHTEDTARRPHAPDRLMARCKRSIDADNQRRHDQIERLDDGVFAYLYEQHHRLRAGAELHSETPASLLDRLSILALKVYHMAREAERPDAAGQHRHRCRQRLAILQEQHHDLWTCLCHLCIDLWEGRKRFKVYRQFKMYNDPELNPEIYRHRAEPRASGRV